MFAFARKKTIEVSTNQELNDNITKVLILKITGSSIKKYFEKGPIRNDSKKSWTIRNKY